MLRILAWVAGLVLLLPALGLTLARLTGSERALAVQAQAFAPAAVPLYAVLALLLVAVVVRSGARLLPAGALVVVLALLAVHAAWLAPLVRSEAAPPGQRLTVMTSNLLLGGADTDAVLATARSRGVDLLVLEEVRPATVARLEAAGVAETYPYRAGSPGDTLVLAREPLAGAVPIGPGPNSWAVRWRGLTVYALHSAYPRRNAAWRADLAALAARARDERPDLMLGDLNATRDHRPLRRILDAGYRDAAEQAGSGWQPTWPAPGTARPLGLPLPPSVAIDHVLVGPRLVATSTDTVVIGDTDHEALVATLVLREA